MRKYIYTNRLILRPPRLSDAQAMTKRLNDPDILRMTASLPMPFFSLCAEFWILRAQADRTRNNSYAYAITGEDDTIMGVVDMFKNSENDWEIGYWISKDFWGKGYMSEAAQALLAESFKTFDTPYIDAGYFNDNPASGRVLEKLGFVDKHEPSALFCVARGQRFPGTELRLSRNNAARWPKVTNEHPQIERAQT